MSGVIGIPPMYANLPSCVLYLRGEGPNGNTQIRDWGKSNQTLTNSSVINSTTITPKFPPTSLYFSSAYITTPTTNVFTPTYGYGYLVAFWIYTTLLFEALIGTRTSDSGSTINWCIYLNSSGVVSVNSYNTSGSAMGTINSSTLLVASTWTHVMLNITPAGVWTLYMNGASVGTYTSTTQVDNQGAAVHVGYFVSSGVPQFLGNMDEVVIFDGVLGTVPTPANVWAAAQYRRMIV